MADTGGHECSEVSKQGSQDDDSESILHDLILGSGGITDLRSSVIEENDKEAGNVCLDKGRRSSILNRSARPRVKKSVSFCSMPEDRRVSNGKLFAS